MTISEFLKEYWYIIGGILALLFAPGAWSFYTILFKYKAAGGTQKTAADLAQKNLDLAERASTYSEKLQQTIEDKEKDIKDMNDAHEEYVKKTEAEIEKYISTIKELQKQAKERDEKVISLENRVDAVEKELAQEKIKTAKQETTIEFLLEKIQRSKDSKERKDDPATFPAGTVIPENKKEK